MPSQGYCEGTWTWHVAEGSFGNVKLDGLHFAAACKWPGQIHEGNGEALPILDQNASPEQLQALGVLLSGQAGGPWEIVAATLNKVHDPALVRWDVELHDAETTITAGEVMTMNLTPMKNPVTGAVHQATVLLPTGFIAHALNKATTSQFAVQAPINYDYTGQDSAWGAFAYSGPN